MGSNIMQAEDDRAGQQPSLLQPPSVLPPSMGFSQAPGAGRSQNPGFVNDIINSYRGLPSASFAIEVSHHASLTLMARKTLEQIQSLPDGLTLPHLASQIYYIRDRKATYQGNFVDGLPQGKAIIHFSQGSCFFGSLVKGNAEGNDGSLYEGRFEGSLFHGWGCLCYQNNKVKYIGQFMKGKPHGNGQQAYEDGELYAGQFANGIKEGKGSYTWKNGDLYEGQFKNGLMNGAGTIKRNNKLLFQGHFKDGQKHGQGQIIREDRSVEGYFQNDHLEGSGTVYFKKTGTIYEGTFKRSLMNGDGYVYEGSARYRARWRNGELVNKGEVEISEKIKELADSLKLKHRMHQMPMNEMHLGNDGSIMR